MVRRAFRDAAGKFPDTRPHRHFRGLPRKSAEAAQQDGGLAFRRGPAPHLDDRPARRDQPASGPDVIVSNPFYKPPRVINKD